MEKWQEETELNTGDFPATGVSGVSGVSEVTGVAAELTSVRFAQIARQLNLVAKEFGLRPPAFRSPPRSPGLHRSIRRRCDGSATVSVALRGRPAVAVVADMIDGVVAANEPSSTRSVDIRDRLWSATTPFLAEETDRSGQLITRRAA